MQKHSFITSIALAGGLALASPLAAQMAPAAAPAAHAAVVAPEGYSPADFATVTADQLKGVSIYDAEGKDVATVADLVIGADNKVTGLVTDVGGFLGMGEHRISLAPDQVHMYKHSDGTLRGYVTLTKDALKAIPAYKAP